MLQDIRYALRWLARSPGFALVAILSIGLGVGVNTAMFSLVDTLLFKPLPVSDPDSLVDVFTVGGDGDEYATSSFADFADLKAQNDVFTDMTAYSPMFAPLALGERSRLVIGQVVTGNHFTFFGIAPHLGRLLVPSDDDPGAARVVVISHRMWQNEFGGTPSAIGQTLTLRGLAYTIVGVTRPDFNGVVPLLTPELWLPMAHVEEVEPAGITDVVPGPGRTRLERRGVRWMFVKGRLKPGVTVEQAHANMSVIGRQLEAAHPQTNKDRRMSAVATSEVRMLVPQASGVLSMGAAALMSVVGLVLLIACANVAGMLLARASARRREISVRLAIGASRGRLVQQLLMEGLVLGTLGATVAIACAWAVIRALTSIQLPLPVNLVLEIGLDWRVMLFAVTAAGLTGVLASLLPALKASAPSLVSDLRGEAPAGRVGGRHFALRDALVVTQVAFTAVLLVVAGLLLRSLAESQRADVGFNVQGLATMSLDTDMVRYSPERSEQFWTDAVARVRAMPGVVSVATATPSLPFELNFNQAELQVDSRTYGEGQRGETIENIAVSAGYVPTLGLRVLEGRDLYEADRKGAPLVALVNETMARRYWPNESAVGRTFTNAVTKDRYTIAGVISNHKVHGVLESPVAMVYFAAAQRPQRYNYLVARTGGSAGQLLAAMRRELLAMEPGLVFVGNSTMEDNLSMSLMPARVGAILVASFGALGTLLAAIGLYGVIAFSVARRTKEIGLRMALGANPGTVLGMVMRQGFGLAGVGLVVGGLLAAGAAFGLSGLLYGITPLDPLAWALAILTMLVAAGAANFVPARRAMRVEPMTALRTE
ncbi:MAG: ABC transporter permease [Acidobacteria bacterium]|nr:ABC transporter permease [Acidobacteriota bacterium]